MQFSTDSFILLALPLTVCGYFLISRLGGLPARLFLVAASLLLYAQGGIRGLFWLLVSVIANALLVGMLKRAGKGRKILLWLGIACHIIGHDSMFMHIWDERELVMDLLEKMTGNRVNYAMVTIGGARRDIDDQLRRELLSACQKLKGPLDRIAEIALTDKTIAMRTKGVGVLTKEDAIRMGAVGPHARASGVAIDVRKDAPYSSYEDFNFKVHTVDSGDVFARVLVRGLECYESIKIIRQALENLPEGPINLGNKLPKIQEGQAVCRHEAPRGQLSHMVVGDGGINNHRVSVHVPSYKNTPTIPHMLRGNTVADAGLIIASIDPCFSCLDR